LPGGGDVEIPEWYMEECLKNGIKPNVLKIKNIEKNYSRATRLEQVVNI